MQNLEIVRFSPQATLPTRAHPDDAGLDLFGLEEFTLAPGEGKVARTGIGIALPPGHVGQVADRSSSVPITLTNTLACRRSRVTSTPVTVTG